MSRRTSSATGRTGHVAVSYKGCIYVWGGYREYNDDSVYFSPLELPVYCELSRKWDIRSCSAVNGPLGMSGSTAAVVGDHMYLFGGYCQNMDSSLSQLYRLCLRTYQWEQLQPQGTAPSSVDKTVSWEHNQKFYVFGGFGSFTNCKGYGFQFTFDPICLKGWTNQFYEYDPDKNEWNVPKYSGPLPLPRAAHASAVVGDRVYIFGGRHLNERMNDLHCLDMQTMTWSGELYVRGPVPEGRSWHSLTSLGNGSLLLYGGFSHSEVALSDCWLLNTATLSWQQVQLPFCKPRLWHSACLTSLNEVIIFGGCASNILRSENRMQPDNIICIAVTPRSLLWLCIDRLGELPELRPFWSSLPFNLQSILNRCFSPARATSLDGS